MKSKTLILLLAICGILAGITWFVFKAESPKTAKTEMGEKLIPDFPVNDVTAMTIQAPDGSVTLQKGESVWGVSDRYGYPADFGKITDLAKKIRDASVGRSFAATDDVRKRLTLYPPDSDAPSADAKATRITFKNSEEKVLADLLVGSARDDGGAGAGGHYVMPARGESVYLVDQSFRLMETDPADWLNKSLFEAPANEVETVTLKTGEGGDAVYTLKRPEKGKDPEFVDLPQAYADREIVKSKVNSLFSSIASFMIEDVADPETPAEKLGFDEVFVYRMFDGRIYRVYPGAAPGDDADGESYYVKVAADFEARPDTEVETDAEPSSADGDEAEAQEKAEAEREKAIAEKQEKDAELKKEMSELNEKLSKWTFVIPEWRKENLAADIENFFEEKETAPEMAAPAQEIEEEALAQ